MTPRRRKSRAARRWRQRHEIIRCKCRDGSVVLYRAGVDGWEKRIPAPMSVLDPMGSPWLSVLR